jgi:hypothetical protein
MGLLVYSSGGNLNEDRMDITDVRRWDEFGASLAEIRRLTIKQYIKHASDRQSQKTDCVTRLMKEIMI